MSKSDPENAILLDDDSESIRTKIRKSFLDVGNDKSPIFEISQNVIMPKTVPTTPPIIIIRPIL